MNIKYINGTVLWSGDAPDIKTALIAAVAARADLRGVNLREANLVGANLWGAKLREANLRGADLWGVNLREANLWGAFLRGANLGGANLGGAYLWGANLRGANLGGADLRGAYLVRADLRGAKYDITQMLKAHWGEVSPEVCAYLMRLDASALPDGERLMDVWAAGGPCPLSESNGVDRVALFQQNKQHWNLAKTLPPITLWELWERLAAEKDVKIR